MKLRGEQSCRGNSVVQYHVIAQAQHDRISGLRHYFGAERGMVCGVEGIVKGIVRHSSQLLAHWPLPLL